MTSSAASPRSSDPGAAPQTLIVCASLCLLVTLSVFWCFHSGCILYYGDAQSHLNLSRSIIDSRTPGYDQLGTVWLPVLHILCLPFVANDTLWSTGLAGSIPVALCFVIAGLCFYLAAREIFKSLTAAIVVLACFALNPNLLYLASIPMTEVVFLAGLAALFLALFRFRATQQNRFIGLGIAASWFMSLTRYDGWFFIPFAALGFTAFAKKHRLSLLIACGGAMSLAPLYWLGHNWWETGHPFDFYSGPFSALAIQAARPYPGYHNWPLALLYYVKACQLCTGWPLLLLTPIGMLCAVLKKVFAPLLFLLATPSFYIWSIHSSAQPIHVPQLWPFSYYNTRYGIAAIPLAAFAAGAIAFFLPPRLKRLAFLLPLLSISPWILHPSPENWICWKESQVNSVSRRAWTVLGRDFLRGHYRTGHGILTPTASGDLAGIFCQARIPLTETLNEGNGPAWFAATSRPDILHPNLWAVAQQGDFVSIALNRDPRSPYRIDHIIQVEDAPTLEIFRRNAGRQ